MSSSKNSIFSKVSLAKWIASGEMSVPVTVNPLSDRFFACVAGPVPKSKNVPDVSFKRFNAFSKSSSRLGLYQGMSETLVVKYRLFQFILSCSLIELFLMLVIKQNNKAKGFFSVTFYNKINLLLV